MVDQRRLSGRFFSFSEGVSRAGDFSASVAAPPTVEMTGFKLGL